MWRPGPVGTKDGFMAFVGDFRVVMAPVARVLIPAIGMQTSWFRTFVVAVAHRWHSYWQLAWKRLVLTGWLFPICDLWWIVVLREAALGEGLLSLRLK